MFLLNIDSESKVDSKKYKFLKCKTFTYLLIINSNSAIELYV